ncbi:hypothetical protein ABW21_db0201457 [Orbilia brochopaga]|nr:hypothetical protein ABW21_db0201457 [Drechslerella brochopaga]
MEYITSGGSRVVTEDEMSLRWDQFQTNLINMFDEEARGLLHETAVLEGDLGYFLSIYCELIKEADSRFLPKVYKGLLPNVDILEGYAMFSLSHGFERALKLLAQDSTEIDSLKAHSRSRIRAWKDSRDSLPAHYKANRGIQEERW